MDCRKLLWLGGLVVGGLVGCNRHETVGTGDPYNASPPPSAPSARNSDSSQAVSVRRKKEVDEPKEMDGKPLSLVQIAEVQAQVALDSSRDADQRQNALKMAKQNYRRAAQRDPKCLPAYVGLARVCSAAGEHELAVHALDAGLAKLPKEAALWYERGMVMGRQKHFDDALANLQRAAQIDPENHQYAKGVGLMLARMGKAEDGVAWLRRVMSEADAHYNIARMMRHIGQAEEGQRQLQLALNADPAHAASLAMSTEGRAAPLDESLQLTGHAEEMQAAVPTLRITIDPPAGDTLPQRPVMKPEPARSRPVVQIGFEPNP